MRNPWHIVIILLALHSCQNIERTEKPDPFFGEDKMSDILVDMYLIEGTQSINRRSFLNTGIKPDSFLYDKYGMDSLSYQKNFYYYADRADEYVQLLELVQTKLEKIKKDVLEEGKLKVEEQRLKDSLKRMKDKNEKKPSDSLIQLDKKLLKVDA
ncbi:hypothetical protein BST97_11845 [Nonlabens spongiae]|uniref:DUF4296 domain-containing protein n=1 Tax=Nonlabens spongiae TaxID=331648 RepID=A0A1W6MLY9_9FLAO|nr:DUF4296 domain-containing protein [Nonlabens spongiae]ARN78624.1 hypothetical protein BST97_11845 [Nonlabens spongiae]